MLFIYFLFILENLFLKSISEKVILTYDQKLNACESDIWLAFLLENKLVQTSDVLSARSESQRRDIKGGDDFIDSDLNNSFEEVPSESFTTNIKDDYEDIHRQCPGLFWDTVTMDDPEAAFIKVKQIIINIIKSQEQLKPMFDIDFANSTHYPIIGRKLAYIRHQIAPQQLFY